MIKKSIPLILAIALIAGLSGIGCTPTPEPIAEPIPQRANLVASIQINEILTDEDLIAAYNDAEKEPNMPQTVDEAMDQIIDETGIDPRDFSEAVIFGDNETFDSEDLYLGAIVKGTLDEAALLDSIEQAADIEMTTFIHHGYEVYSYTSSDNPLCLCFLTEDTLVIGNCDAIRDAIEVAVGYAPTISGPVADTYTSFGDVMIKVAMEIPPELMEDIPEDEVPVDSEMLENIEVVGASLDKVGENISLQVKVCFSSAGLAAAFHTLLQGAITFIPLSEDVPPEAVDMLSKIDVTRTGPCTTASLTATMEEIEAFIEAMEDEDF